MSQWSKRTRETKRHEYVLPDPTNHVEMGKAFTAAYADLKQATGKDIYDDSVWVTHEDEVIIIYWEETK